MYKNYFILYIGMYASLFLCSILSNIINTDFIVLFLFILFIIVFLKKNFYTIPKYISIYVYTFIFLVGVFICENFNFYLRELNVISKHYGSFPMAVLYSMILISSLLYFDKKYSRRMFYNFQNLKSNLSVFISNYIYIFIFFGGIVLFLSVITVPSFKMGIDRFQYEQIYLNKYVKLFASYYKYLLPFTILPMILKNGNIKKKISKILISLTPYILYKVWVGNKFGAIFDILILFFPIIIFYVGNIKNNFNLDKKQNLIIVTKASDNIKIFKSLGIIFIFLVFILSIFYISRGKDAKSSIIDRVSQQGQLWWKIYGTYEIGELHISEINDELIPLFNYNDMSIYDYKFGVYKMMQLTTPNNIYKAKIATGARYSSQGIEIAYYYFNIVGLVVHAILRGFFIVIIINLYIKYFFSGRFLESIIMARILIINNSIFTQGDLYNLTKPEFIIMLIILIVMNMVYKKNSHKNLSGVKSYE